MGSNIVNAVRQLKQDLVSKLGPLIAVKLSPSSSALDATKLSALPALILQGPEITNHVPRFDIKSIRAGVNGEGTYINEVKKARSELDLSFRLRLFTDTLLQSLFYLEALEEIVNSYATINVQEVLENVTFSENNPVELSVTDHGLEVGDSVTISDSSDLDALNDGSYAVQSIEKTNVKIPFNGTGVGGTCGVSYIKNRYLVNFGEEFSSDTVPNFSDLKHYESSVTIESVTVEQTTSEDVFEVKTFNSEFYKL